MGNLEVSILPTTEVQIYSNSWSILYVLFLPVEACRIFPCLQVSEISWCAFIWVYFYLLCCTLHVFSIWKHTSFNPIWRCSLIISSLSFSLFLFSGTLIIWMLVHLDESSYSFSHSSSHFLSLFFYSLLYLFFYSSIFQILNFYLGCLSLNLQGLILFFVLFCFVCLSYECLFLFGIMFLFYGCSVFSYFSETNEDFLKKSILLSTWSFSPPVTFTYLLEAFLR